ncbi:DUF7483 domain-containing protein [Chitinimonas naiadis]
MRVAAGKSAGAAFYASNTYTGNGATLAITSNLNLAAGGLVLTRRRDAAAGTYAVDSARGAGNALLTSSPTAQVFVSGGTTLTATGFSMAGAAEMNSAGGSYVAWQFMRQANCFDVVTFAGNNGASQQFNHSLGVAPGLVILKGTGSPNGPNWIIYHKDAGNNSYNGFVIDAWTSSAGSFAASATTFTVGSQLNLNQSGGTCVAYLFAHDTSPTGQSFSGSYVGNGSASGPTINIGWQPRFILLQGGTNPWQVVDTTRGIASPGNDAVIAMDTATAETSADNVTLNATGFQLVSASAAFNATGVTYYYHAIR